nr:hypothetical protein [Tanacetum cinerariifolium]
GPGRSRRPVQRRRHGGSALHHAASSDRPQVGQGRVRRAPESGVRQGPYRSSAGRQSGRSADRQAKLRKHAGSAGASLERRRQGL